MLKVLRPAIARVLTPVGQVLARTPITPNALTIIGTIGMSVGALTLFPTGHLFAGVMVCTGFVLTDMLDGTLARIKGTTGRFGAFLDSTMDRIADAAVFVGLAAWFVLRGDDKVLAGVAVYCLVAGALVSYAKARAESVGLKCDVGFAERTERLLIALVATGLAGLGVPYVLPIGLWLLAAASTVTFGQRVVAARRSAARLEAKSGEAADGTRAPGLDGGASGGVDRGAAGGLDSGAARGLDGGAAGGVDGGVGGGLDGGAAGSGSPARAGRGASAAPTGDHRDAASGG